MSSFLGRIDYFDHTSSDWDIFLGRLNQFFKVNSVIEEAKTALLLTHLSEESYRIARNVVFPRELEQLAFSEVTKALTDYFKPKRCLFAERARFYAAVKYPGESVGEWAARLRGLASYCNFGIVLDTVLRDRFVLGLSDGPERDKLFEKDATTLTFTNALELAEKVANSRQAKQSVHSPGTAGVTVKEEAIYKMSEPGCNAHGYGGGRAGTAAGSRASATTWRQQGAGSAAAGAGTAAGQARCAVCGLRNHVADKCRYKRYRCLRGDRTPEEGLQAACEQHQRRTIRRRRRLGKL